MLEENYQVGRQTQEIGYLPALPMGTPEVKKYRNDLINTLLPERIEKEIRNNNFINIRTDSRSRAPTTQKTNLVVDQRDSVARQTKELSKLRLDGVYHSQNKNNDSWQYLRFYEEDLYRSALPNNKHSEINIKLTAYIKKALKKKGTVSLKDSWKKSNVGFKKLRYKLLSDAYKKLGNSIRNKPIGHAVTKQAKKGNETSWPIIGDASFNIFLLEKYSS